MSYSPVEAATEVVAEMRAYREEHPGARLSARWCDRLENALIEGPWCECGEEDCEVRLPLAAWEHAGTSSDFAAIHPDHAGGCKVVERLGGYVIVPA